MTHPTTRPWSPSIGRRPSFAAGGFPGSCSARTRAWCGRVIGAALLAFAVATGAFELEGRVVGVADGDTVTVLDARRVQHRIRLAGIDAPEKGQPFGQRSKQNLSALVFGRPVRIEWHKQDRYGRKVGKVWIAAPDCLNQSCPKTVDANLAQLAVGLAWWHRDYASEQPAADRGRYEFAEADSRKRQVGLWADRAPLPPWEWRRQRRQSISSLHRAARRDSVRSGARRDAMPRSGR